MRLIIILGIALSAGFCLPISAAIPGPHALDRSVNNLFSLDISSETPDTVLITMQRHDGDRKIFQWAKKIDDNKNVGIGFALPLKPYISNDGKSAIVHNQRSLEEGWLWVSKDEEPRWYYLHEFSREMGSNIGNNAFGDPLYGAPSTLVQFIARERNVFALWFPRPDKWITIDLQTGELNCPSPSVIGLLVNDRDAARDLWLRPPSEDILEILNAEAKDRSLEKVRKHQPNFINSILTPLRRKVGEFIPGVAPSNASSYQLFHEAYGSYLFLARHKVPEAEKYLRALLDFPFQRKMSSLEHREPPFFTVRSDERALGDLVWRMWNDVPIDAAEDDNRRFEMRYTPGHFLGGVTGRVNLPMVRPDKDPGALWIYLVPNDEALGEWKDSKDIITLYCDLSFGFGRPGRVARFWPGSNMPEIEFDAIDFRFLTITPGEYRIKAVWDRRGPYAPMDGRGLPDAGDYEAAESAPFAIAAGTVLNLSVIECTNKVGRAENYYAADETWKKTKPFPTTRLFNSPIPMSQLVFPAPPSTPLSRWGVVTNVASKKMALKRIEAVQPQAENSTFKRHELIVTFEPTETLEQKARFNAVVRDSHNCALAAFASVTPMRGAPKEITVRIPIFPRFDPFTLELRSADGQEVICSYRIRNAGPSEHSNFARNSIPITRKLGENRVRLDSLTRKDGARFTLLGDAETSPWNPESVVYQDSVGNRSFDPSDFCQQEKIIKVQVRHNGAARDFIAPLE